MTDDTADKEVSHSAAINGCAAGTSIYACLYKHVSNAFGSLWYSVPPSEYPMQQGDCYGVPD